MAHIVFFGFGLGMVIYGIYANTRTQTHLRKKMLKKYVVIYLVLVMLVNFIIFLFS